MCKHDQRCWATVDLDRVAHNAAALRSNVGGVGMLAAVKADGYGHGDVAVARRLEAEGVEWFGVSNIQEALRLRENGITRSLLILGPTPPEYAVELAKWDITQTVHSAFYAGELHAAARAAGVQLCVHLKIDTGMGRIGFQPEDIDTVAEVCRLPGFDARGIFTHFACSDGVTEEERAYTYRQYSLFVGVIKALEEQGITFALRHCCNSAAAIQYPEMALDMVRCGIAIYGLCPSPELKNTLDLRPAMEWHAVVTMVKELPAGSCLSYGRTFTTRRASRIATVGMGYADGYLRALGNRGAMLVRGQPARVAGRVCMDQLLLDVTDIDGAAPGDLVTVCGRDGAHTLELDDIAALCGTINYETACLVGKRVPRVYRQGGKLL